MKKYQRSSEQKYCIECEVLLTVDNCYVKDHKRLNNICKSCMGEKIRKKKIYKPKRSDDTKRDTIITWSKYMIENPEYFKYVFGLEVSEYNVKNMSKLTFERGDVND
jgi:hypothetical protein